MVIRSICLVNIQDIIGSNDQQIESGNNASDVNFCLLAHKKRFVFHNNRFQFLKKKTYEFQL